MIKQNAIAVSEAEFYLDEFRACRPFFIGLLGERYGWVPGDDAFTADLREEQPWLKDLHGKSRPGVTSESEDIAGNPIPS